MEFPTNFPRTTTKSGVEVVLFTNQGGGDFTLLGAYYAGDRWIPSAWTIRGSKFLDHESLLDINLEGEKNENT